MLFARVKQSNFLGYSLCSVVRNFARKGHKPHKGAFGSSTPTLPKRSFMKEDEEFKPLYSGQELDTKLEFDDETIENNPYHQQNLQEAAKARNETHLIRIKNTHRNLIEGNIKALTEVLTRESTTDLKKFMERPKRVAAMAQFLDKEGLIQMDINVLKPIMYQDQKIVPCNDQLIIETDKRETQEFLLFLKVIAPNLKLSIYDLTNQIKSYRLINLYRGFSHPKDHRGKLHKEFYPPPSSRPTDWDSSSFLDLSCFNPRSHQLGLSVYSAGDSLDLETEGIMKGLPWVYMAGRGARGIPEGLESYGLSLEESGLDQVNSFFNQGEFTNKEFMNSRNRGRKLKFALVFHEPVPVYGESQGFPRALFDPKLTLPPSFRVVLPNGSEPFKPLAQYGNLMLIALEEGVKARQFEQSGFYVSVFDINREEELRRERELLFPQEDSYLMPGQLPVGPK